MPVIFVYPPVQLSLERRVQLAYDLTTAAAENGCLPEKVQIFFRDPTEEPRITVHFIPALGFDFHALHSGLLDAAAPELGKLTVQLTAYQADQTARGGVLRVA